MVISKGMLLVLGMVLGWHLCPGGKPTVTAPGKGAVWREGEIHEIRWQGFSGDQVCISVLLGGKDTGILNDCATPGSQGRYSWHIPQGFVSGFGIEKETRARVCICPKNDQTQCTCSPFFTIQGSGS